MNLEWSEMAKKNDSRVPTGIAGLDKLINGGFIKNSLNLVSGGAGSGKSILCLQYIYAGVKEYDDNCLLITFDENAESIRGDAMTFGWDLEELEKSKKLKVLALQPFDSKDLKQDIEDAITKHNVKRVVIDSISVFSMAFKDDWYKLRKELYRLSGFLKKMGCTVLVTAEVRGEVSLDVTAASNPLTHDGVIEYVADAVMTLHNTGIGGDADRAIRVVKMRRTNHRRDPVPMKITDKGIVVTDS